MSNDTTTLDLQITIITAIGFSSFAAIVVVGIILIMIVSHKLFDDKEKLQAEKEILQEKLKTAKHRNEQFKKEQLNG